MDSKAGNGGDDMREKTETARSTAATVERATETGTTCEAASTSENNSNTPAAGCPQISDYLLCGAENGLMLSDLHRLTGIDKRAIRAAIQRERLSGTPILSSTLSGYFLPANEQEREQCVRSLRHRAGEILAVASAIERGRSIE